jgi:KRAB domain-containing zinc finger protein
LNYHQYVSHKKEKHVCETCGFETHHKDILKEHITLKHKFEEATKLLCEKCDFSTVIRRKMTKHMTQKHDLDKHKKCPHCEFSNPTNQKLQIHIDNNHSEIAGEKKHFCEKCTRGFIFVTSLKDHHFKCLKAVAYIKEKQGSTKNLRPAYKIKCDFCDEMLNSTKSVKHHYRNEHPGKSIIADGYTRYNCTNCDEFFFTKYELQRHLNLDHEIETKLKFCKKCKRGYANEHNHCIMEHNGEYLSQKQRMVCELCGTDYYDKQALQKHMQKADH